MKYMRANFTKSEIMGRDSDPNYRGHITFDNEDQDAVSKNDKDGTDSFNEDNDDNDWND